MLTLQVPSIAESPSNAAISWVQARAPQPLPLSRPLSDFPFAPSFEIRTAPTMAAGAESALGSRFQQARLKARASEGSHVPARAIMSS